MEHRASITLFVLALIPNPFFDIAGAAAGAHRVPLWKFLVYGGAGRILKHTFFACAGALGMESVLRFLIDVHPSQAANECRYVNYMI